MRQQIRRSFKAAQVSPKFSARLVMSKDRMWPFGGVVLRWCSGLPCPHPIGRSYTQPAPTFLRRISLQEVSCWNLKLIDIIQNDMCTTQYDQLLHLDGSLRKVIAAKIAPGMTYCESRCGRRFQGLNLGYHHFFSKKNRLFSKVGAPQKSTKVFRHRSFQMGIG
jgi:hypothetical protein